MGRFKYNIGDAVGPYSNILLKRVEKIGRKWRCKFKCEKCDNTFIVGLSEVSSGSSHLCASCQRKVRSDRCKKIGQQSYYKDYSNIDNPFYIFIKYVDEYDYDGNRYWLIKCKKCGKTYKEIPSQLISKTRRRGNNPCKCWRTTNQDSKGNIIIEKILVDNNITFIKEKTFEDCINPKTAAKLKFDFYLPDYNCCIEYDGEQHFREVPVFGDNTLESNQIRDNIKNTYCFNNNIKLIRIPCYDYKRISYDYLIERGCFG